MRESGDILAGTQAVWQGTPVQVDVGASLTDDLLDLREGEWR
ncbi:MAG: hypothetical protein ACR2MA_12870 [Egibacteraceae bacterium]